MYFVSSSSLSISLNMSNDFLTILFLITFKVLLRCNIHDQHSMVNHHCQQHLSQI